jgi:aspartate/methionine/tyrosine aminotransferase
VTSNAPRPVSAVPPQDGQSRHRGERPRWYIAERTGVQLLPGQTLSCPEPGYFRLCFTAYDRDTITTAVRLIGEALGQLVSHAPQIGWQPTADATV